MQIDTDLNNLHECQETSETVEPVFGNHPSRQSSAASSKSY